MSDLKLSDVKLSGPKVLVVGAYGQLGTDLLARLGDRAVGVDRDTVDITDPDAATRAVDGFDLVINAAAYTAVDKAESDEATAFAVNAVGPANLARATRANGARLVHVSTDYVFAGNGTAPYGEDDPQIPLGAYGRTKAAGEWAVLSANPDSYIVRTAWLYGLNGQNFVRTMMRLEKEKPQVTVVDDQRGSPTFSRDLAGALVELAASSADFGIYHYTNAGVTTWHGFASEVFRLSGADPARVLPIDSGKLDRAAPRPSYSVLSHSRWLAAGLTAPRDWRAALAEFMKEAE